MYQTTLTNVYSSLGPRSASSSSGSLSAYGKVTLGQWSPLHSLSADWLHLNTFPHMEDALSRTGRFINTWKIGFAMKANQCSSHLHWVKPWIETFWSNYSDTQYWLTGPEHFSTCGRCFTKDQRTPQHLENGFIIHSDGTSTFCPCYWIMPWIHTFWAQGSGIQSWLSPPEYQSTHGASQD